MKIIILGINLAHEYPSEIYAYIGISQVVDFVKGNEISYQFSLKTAKERDMTDKVEKLIEIGESHLREGIAAVSLVSSYVSKFGGAFHIPVDVGGIMGESVVVKTTYNKILPFALARECFFSYSHIHKNL